MKDKQRETFNQLITEKLPKAIAEKSQTISDELQLDCSLVDLDTKNAIKDEDGTLYVPIVAKCVLRNVYTTESVTFNINLLKLPVYTETGFFIRGNYMQMLDSYDKTSGLHTVKKITQSSDEDKAIIQSDKFNSVGFVRDKSKLYTEISLAGRVKDAIQVSPATFLRAITGMSIEDLVVKFGYDNNFIVSIFDGNTSTFPECKAGFSIDTRNDCIQAVYAAIFGKQAALDVNNGTSNIKLQEIKRRLFTHDYFAKGEYATQQIQYVESFSYRANGKVLVDEISSNGIHIDAGTLLSSQILRDLDATEIDTIKVSYNGMDYTLHKFSRYWFGALNYTLDEDLDEFELKKGTVLDTNDIDTLNSTSLKSIHVIDTDGQKRVLSRDIDQTSLTIDDVFTVFDIWVNNLSGLNIYDRQFDLTNRIIYPFDKRVLDLVDEHLLYVVNTIKKNYEINGASVKLGQYIENFDKRIRLNAFIDQIRSPQIKLGQMSEMCNVMSFVSKDYKSTIANLKNIDDDLITIQDHQYGRTDPFDIPESKKLASVQYRTVLSKLNDAGYIIVPYLRVSHGEIVDDQPVYLTAIEETDRYIAQWDETFVDENGNKKAYVTARCNGEIVSVDTDSVSYKEYSPYLGMSISHACIPFPGHSDAKRITMGCNQLSQATPMAHISRPFVNSGGESMVDYGFYKASDVLESFYNSEVLHIPYLKDNKDQILNSDIKLVGKYTEHGTMTLTFAILAMNAIGKQLPTFANQQAEIGSAFHMTDLTTYDLKVPYAMQTNDNTLMTYNINAVPFNIYHPDDIICYSNSCSLETKEFANCMDTGAQTLPVESFNRGLALVTNLRVGYKTWEGSTIDDAMTISDDCIYDDLLTSIFTTRVILEAKTFSDTEFEEFGVLEHKYRYFEENGLPKIGTYLNAGDPIIAKIAHTDGKSKAKYKFLKMNQSGQVVHAGFTKKNNEEVAEVILAQRAVVDVGDKFAGRCGNKGVVAKIVPAEQMPYDPETGFRLQVILNPLGVPSRQNISQFLDVDLSECMRQEDKYSYVSPYNGNDLQFVLDMKEVHDVKPKIFIDGRTGKPFKRPIHWGTISLYKLHHMIKKKYHAIGMSAPVDPVFMQPRKSSKLDGGQSFGEMEAWCLMSVGATHVLQEIYSYQSTDIRERGIVRADLESGQDAEFYVSGNNRNESTMLACFRSLGIDFSTNTDEACFEFPPLTDQKIRSFSASPVDSALNLHNSSIFGCGSSELHSKDISRNYWGWIDLKMELVHPNFIHNSKILKLIHVMPFKSFTPEIAEYIMQGYISVEKETDYVTHFVGYKTKLCPESPLEVEYVPEEETASKETITGLPALVMMFKLMDTKSLEAGAQKACISWLEQNKLSDPSELEEHPEINKQGYLTRASWYHFVKTFNDTQKLSDYVISSFPVIPQIYRPQFAGDKQSQQLNHVDFDWHYVQILNAITAMEHNRTTQTQYAVYQKIKSFCGLNRDMTREEKKHKNIKTYFSGSDNGDHGKIRTNVQSKRIFCSGRTTIIPASDTRMKPTEIGVPLTIAVKMYESQLIGIIKKDCDSKAYLDRNAIVKALLYCAKRDKRRFVAYWDEVFAQKMPYGGEKAYDIVTKKIYDFVEGRSEFGTQVVLSGRQPSLHKYAIRAYIPKIVLDNAIHVHTLVCSGYNADFDGDQMWLAALISREAREEALRLLSPAVDYVNPKDNSLILKHTQDVVLGLYCMSMLEKNATSVSIPVNEIQHYQNVEQIVSDLESDNLNPWDVACVTVNGRNYISTAGRIHLNSIVDGFTEDVYTNPLGLNLDPTKFCELRYDGIWRSGGNVKTGNFRYFKIADICMDIYNEGDDDYCLDIMQKLTELGFKYADKFGISLSIEDLMLTPVDESEKVTDPKLIDLDEESLSEICRSDLDKAEKLKVSIEQDYHDGLISEEDKDDAVIALYYNGTGDKESEYKDGIHSKVMTSLMDKLGKTQRNNNIFILLDSGARGKADQIMRMCGFLPQLQKDKIQSLKTPVTNSFLNGLSAFDVHMTSYGVKQGLASTQNETPLAGYATHKGVYMTSGIQIVESDCGKADWWYDVQYADMDESKILFLPTQQWFNEHLVGKSIAPDDEGSLKLFNKTVDSRIITEADYRYLSMSEGFHTIQLEDDIFDMDLLSIIGKTIHKSDNVAYIKLKNTLINRDLTMKSAELLEKVKLPSLATLDGTYTFKYKMDSCSKSLLLYRECKDLPYTIKRIDPMTGGIINVTSQKTVEYIEEKNLRRVPVRILLDCKCEHGVCAHCYGLKFSSLKFPEVGEFVGTEAAQAIGEPSAQLTISLVNQGGSAGAAINDGVARFSSLLDGSIKDPAVLAPRSGYVSIERLGQKATVSVKPVDKHCELCSDCNFGGECPSMGTGIKPCTLSKTVDVDLLNCKDGDWVEASQPLTIQIPSPDLVTAVTLEGEQGIRDTDAFVYVFRRKQVLWMTNYYETFNSKGIDINARHFELLARIQNMQGFVYSSDNPDFQVGETYEIESLLKAGSVVKFEPCLSKRADVVLKTSGAMASLSFERIQSIAAKLCVNSYKSPYEHNNSLLGSIAVGTDLTTNTPKKLGATVRIINKPKTVEPVNAPLVTYKKVQHKMVDESDDIFSNINFDSMFSAEPAKMDIDAEPIQQSPKEEPDAEVKEYIPSDYDMEEYEDTSVVQSTLDTPKTMDLFEDSESLGSDLEEAMDINVSIDKDDIVDTVDSLSDLDDELLDDSDDTSASIDSDNPGEESDSIVPQRMEF